MAFDELEATEELDFDDELAGGMDDAAMLEGCVDDITGSAGRLELETVNEELEATTDELTGAAGSLKAEDEDDVSGTGVPVQAVSRPIAPIKQSCKVGRLYNFDLMYIIILNAIFIYGQLYNKCIIKNVNRLWFSSSFLKGAYRYF